MNALYDAVVNGDAKQALALVQEALAAGADPLEVVTGYLAPAMEEVGRRFECEEYFVPELLLSARAMKGAMARITPLLANRGAEPVGRVVIGTVKGDLHDIGKNLVAAMLEGAGFKVVDLGVDVAPEKFVEAAKQNSAQIIAMSALLTTTMGAMKETVSVLGPAGLEGTVKVMIGGAPVTQSYADEIKASAYAPDAASAVEQAKSLLH